MKVYLLLTEDGRRQFYGEAPEGTDEADVAGADLPQPGLLHWFARKRTRLMKVWQHADGRVIRVLRRIWEGLNRRVFPDEAWLVRFRSEAAIEVRHPSLLSDAEARAAWAEFLDGRLRRHLPWLVFYVACCPLTILLGPLPGPNVIGYWFAYRAVRHLMVLRGLRRARRGEVETTFHPTEALDRPLRVGRVTVTTSGAKVAA